MIVRLRDDLIGVRHPLVWIYLLVEGEEVVALDTGMGGSFRLVQSWFRRTNRSPEQLKAILLTHGHLDHAGCAEPLRRWSGAPVYLHQSDLPILRGQFAYQGWARVCGWLEAVGRPMGKYLRPKIDRYLEDGQELPFWGGLRVIHLPGHTPGHCGFYSEAKKILFIGDAILYEFGRCGFPLPIFNWDSQLVRESVLRVADLEVDWVYPMHHRGLKENLIEQIRRYAKKRK